MTFLLILYEALFILNKSIGEYFFQIFVVYIILIKKVHGYDLIAIDISAMILHFLICLVYPFFLELMQIRDESSLCAIVLVVRENFLNTYRGT